MQRHLEELDKSRTASSRLSLLHLIRPEGRIFVFTRTRQDTIMKSKLFRDFFENKIQW
ncbi:Uncharacterised protein [Sphingobacterium spiritivorum]|uniref:Uncharacterized protein n=1 Tax=Sphingobacterium spiritivorum ATCC 33861 TaxID=525373 RepID=D7VNN0_SPHSI|nr:hypothetical protein HMPREF0766_12600 [Sphingobacterium spiritivorum ATCC 33861]SUJ19192.1 Uncharacterised protein [Sphingobacterium spiritivorum]